MLELICKELGVEIGEEWLGNDGNKFKINESGNLIKIYESGHTFNADNWLPKLLTGELKPIWKPKIGEIIYIPALFGEDDLYIKSIWYNEKEHNLWLKRGLVFKTKDEAIECTNKMLEVIE